MPRFAVSKGFICVVVGVALFVGASAFACWRTTGRLLKLRLGVVAAIVVGVALVADADPVWPLAVVAAGLLVIVISEEIGLAEDAPLGEASTAFD